MPENCNTSDCPLVPRIKRLEVDSEHNKEAHKEFYSKLEGSHTDVALIEERVSQIKEDTEEIKASVRELRDKPARRWDSLVDKTLWAIAAAVITYLLARAGL